MNVLIADSGASKTDWAYIEDGNPVYFRTSGLHPSYLDPNAAYSELQGIIGDLKPDVIQFFGAGCVSEKASQPVQSVLNKLYGGVILEIGSDLLAVAQAFISQSDGVAAILGTGSSSGRFQAGELVEQVPSLGYVLGDEGSACDIAKRLLRQLLRGGFKPETKRVLGERLGSTDTSQLTMPLYRSERPSFYLGSLTKKVFSTDTPAELHAIARESFQSFIDSQLSIYRGFPNYNLVIAGGVATSLATVLREVLAGNGFEQVTIQENIITALAQRAIDMQSG